MKEDNQEFDLSKFITDSLSLDNNIFPHVLSQYKKNQEEPVLKLLRKNPREALGFNSFSEPRQVPESEVGTTIQEFYRGLNVFVTGGTGFMGKILIERLIRLIPHLGLIYVLIRPKKGVPVAERFEKLLEDEVFLRMKTEVPDYWRKLTCVEGDILEPELGLSEADRQILQSKVHVVFHSAADVRFINSLRAAFNSNVLGSKKVIDLAKGMRNLKSYVHVSTAFSNCVRRVVEEKCYKLNVCHTDIEKLLEEKSDDEIRDQENRILQGWPNTYTFSKAICEDMIATEAKELPICIFRPSIVWPAYKEPLRAWTDNVYGPNGLLMAIALGVFHILKIDISIHIDTVPVDFAVNGMIAVAWENATDRINAMPVYNFTSWPRNPINFKVLEAIARKWIDVYPYQQAIWHPSFIDCKSTMFESFVGIFLHKIPGLIFDRILIATGQQPRLTRVYDRISVIREKLDFFLSGTWEFRNDNITLLLSKLTEVDKKLFYFDIADMNKIDEYFVLGRLAVKYFYLKENLDTISDAERKAKWLKLAHYTLLTLSSLVTLKVLVVLAHILPI